MSIFDRLLSATAETAIEAAIASLGFASHGGTYQPEEPKELCAYAEMKSAENK